MAVGLGDVVLFNPAELSGLEIWLKTASPAACTVSMAVAIAVCIGMFGIAVTVAVTMEAIYLEYSLE